ncbi:MAG: protein-L-isoaspartate(D-aspartate) O-methyltransferase [Gammaproteobacteria bacterium]|jgi:protein-L-isoaspartate(D-aspartate) O-methyltransferase|nr:protein-L-isoaspartate(D-aspartate) O-methyltransferase [Gammaproteobacteria bacterium]
MVMRKKMQRLLDEIESEYRFTRGMTGKAMLGPELRQAISNTPRDKFVPLASIDSAFDNHPLSIGYGQTISQPYIVAIMTDLLELKADDVVLEIGTGSGYQAAILSQLCRQVYTIEYVAELADQARARFERLGYDNIVTMSGNGFDGLPEHAPYDGIIVTAAATHIPGPLIEQLKAGGRMIIPVGRQYSHQELKLVIKNQQGDIEVKDILSVVFVPFQGERNE